MEPQEKSVRVWVGLDPLQGKLMEQLLKDNGIEFFSNRDTGVLGAFAQTSLWVAKKDETRARALLETAEAEMSEALNPAENMVQIWLEPDPVVAESMEELLSERTIECFTDFVRGETDPLTGEPVRKGTEIWVPRERVKEAVTVLAEKHAHFRLALGAAGHDLDSDSAERKNYD